MEKEIWEDITCYEGLYQVSNFGNVKSLTKVCNGRVGNLVIRKEKLLKLNENKLGYIQVHLCVNRIIDVNSVHRLVALAFIQNPENKPQVNHINGVKKDNRVENLEWCTASENMKHAFNTGLSSVLKGSEVKTSKLTPEQVLEIRNIKNKTQKEISLIYNISYGHVSDILLRKRWAHI